MPNEVEAIPAMPPAVASAITKVMAGVPRLTKSERNTHGNYNFASIDDFLEAVRPLCAEHGLIILQDEFSSEMIDGGSSREGKARRFLSVTYKFTLAHSGGDTWAHRPTRTIIVDASMGSQAYGAAQSYTLKLFERSLFQIATGEKGQDVDEHPNTDLPNRKRTKAEIQDAAAFKRGEHKRVQEDVSQITSLTALERYKQEVLTPDYMSKMGTGQYAIEEMVASREAELKHSAENAETTEAEWLTRLENAPDRSALNLVIADMADSGMDRDLEDRLLPHVRRRKKDLANA